MITMSLLSLLSLISLLHRSFLRLGFLVDSLSAINGFIGGASIVIGLQQLKGLLGLSHCTDSTDVVSVIRAVWVSVHEPISIPCFFSL